jgi:hypothetical protein
LSLKTNNPKTMKTVYTNDEIPHLWAHQTQEYARGAGSISFRDKTGYSYAMPICRHEVDKHGRPCILFTTKGYSVTTSKHISMFARAIPSDATVYQVPTVCTSDHASNITELDRAIADLATKAHKARPGTLKAASLAEQLTNDIANRNAYALAFKVRTKPLDTEQAAKLSAKLERDAAKARKLSERLAKEREASERAEHAIHVAEWIAGQRDSVPYFAWERPVYLRAKGDEMETSQGARVPLSHAKRAIQRVCRVREAGVAWQRNGETVHVGVYQLDSISETGDVVAGCHRITWTEIERFARSQGWL